MLSGGKCANGAVTAAFANLYNKFGLKQGIGDFFRGVEEGVVQLGYDLFIANGNGPYPTGLGVLFGATPGAIYDAPTSSANAWGRLIGGFGAGTIAGGRAGYGATTTRVGRWMSKDELAKMRSSGRVQESTSGLTHVSNPASIAVHQRQAPAGSVYSTFRVPTSRLHPSGTGSSAIRGPNYRLKPVSSMPRTRSIRVEGSK